MQATSSCYHILLTGYKGQQSKPKTITYRSVPLIIPRKARPKVWLVCKKKQNVKKLILEGKKLPWLNLVKCLGTTLTDVLDDMGQGLAQKRVQCIAENNEITLFQYVQTPAKVLAKNIFSAHFLRCTFLGLVFSSLPKTREIIIIIIKFLFYSILFYSILFYSILFCCVFAMFLDEC